MEPEKAAKEEKSKDPENVGDGKQDVKPPKSDVNTDMEGGNKNEEKEIEDNKSLTRESEPREPVATVHDESTEALDTDQSASEEIVETVADQPVSEETVETSEDQPASEEILETNANQPVSEQIVETDLSEEIVEIDSNQPVSEVIVGADENQPVSEEIVETDANELVSEEIVETDANQPETEDIIEAVPEAATASEDNPKDKDGTLSTEEEKKATEGNATKPMNERRGRKRKASSDDEAKDDSIAAASEQKSSDKINDSKDENLDKIEDSKDEKSSKTDEFTENAADRIKSRKRKASEMLTGTEGSASEEGEVAKMETEKDNHTLNNASELGMPPKQTFGKGKRARIPNKRYSDIMLPAQGRHKSPSSASVPPNVENGSTKKTDKVEKVEKIEPEVVASTSKVEPSTPTPNPRSNTSSPALKRNKGPSVNVKDKIFLKPMKRGWKRELVIRGVQDSSSEKRTCDIYYYTPEGKKLRSMREVADFLLYNRVKELTIQNFTFYKEPLGLNDPAKEIIRNAQGARTPKVLSPKLNSPKVGQDTPPVKRAAPVPSQLATKSVDSTSTPKMNEVASSSKERGQQQQSPSPSKSKRVTRNLGGFKVKLTPAKDKPAVSEKRIASIALARAAKVQKASLRAAANKAATSTPSTPSPGKQQIKEEKMEIVETPVNNNNNKKNNAARKTGGTTTPAAAAAAKTPAPVVASTKSVESPKAKRRATKLNNVTSEKSSSGGGPLTLMGSYLQNMSYGYTTLLSVFQYLKVQDLLRAGCVCTMWRDMAGHPSLWRTVRMKNSQVHSFQGLANTLQKHGTVHLDLRKMLLPTTEGDNIWPEFSKAIEKVQSLRKIELCRCPASVVEKLAVTNKELEVINAVTIKCESMSLDKLKALKNLKELRLKSTSGLTLSSDITALKGLTQLKNLSLTSIKDLNKLNLSVISALTNLESLDLGECTDLPDNFGCDILIKLTKLEKLRLEKGQGNCHTFEILDAIQNMPQLEQLELVNFDIKPGFDVALGACKNLKKLLVIPTYISQSATTNHMVLGGVLRLQSTLSHFVWGVTLELLRVTELFVDQCEDPDKKDKKERKQVGNGDSIPVLKPVPLITDKDDAILPAHDPPQVEILPLPNLQKLLLQSLPTTRVKILKIPFHATWRQNITDTVN